MSEASDFCNLLFRIAEDHNGENVVQILGGVPVLVIQDFDTAQHVLRHNAGNYLKNMIWFRQALGASRFTENGEAWRSRQAASQAYLSRFDRQRAFEIAARRGRTALDRLATAGTERMDDSILREMAAAIMLEAFFGADLAETGIRLDDIAHMLIFGSEYSFVPEKALIPFPREVTRAFLGVRARVLDDLGKLRRAAPAQGTLLADMLAMDEASPNFVFEHEMTMFFAAASETTAATMGWACFLLARNPDIQDRLTAAVDAFWAGPGDWEHLERLSPLLGFIAEVLRMFPSTPVIARRAIVGERLGTHDIEAGEQVLISLAGIQHDRRRHSAPWKLDIDRAAEGAGSGHSISFSVGPRMCGGFRFALTELMTLLAVFLRDGRFVATSQAPPAFRFQTQLMHEGGQPVHVYMRERRG